MEKKQRIKYPPLLKVIIPLILGIIYVYHFPSAFKETCIIILFLIIILWAVPKKIITSNISWNIGAFIFFMSIGMLLIKIHLYSPQLPSAKLHYKAVVTEEVKDPNQVLCEIRSYSTKDFNKKAEVKVALYIPNFIDTIPEIGDSIFFSGYAQTFKPNANPYEFNYHRYRRDNGVFYNIIVPGKIQVGGKSDEYGLKRLSVSIQHKIIEFFSDNGLEEKELGIVAALIAGNRDVIKGEQKEMFARSGTMHILAVSGLHVGIVFMFLNIFLMMLGNKFAMRLIRFFIILISIWIYAFITGFSPSVVRASIMFSFLLFGTVIQRSSNSYNTLLLSAITTLTINPLNLFNVGFQFSYIAVFGILFFYNRIFYIIQVRNKILNLVWQLIVVSIAAQLTVLPLSLFYFHTFPVLFWAINVMVIPLVWLIMLNSSVSLVFSFSGGVLSVLIGVLSILIKSLNTVVAFFARLEWFIIDDIHFTLFHLIISYAFLLSLVFILESKKKQWIHATAILLTIFIFYSFIYDIYQKNVKEIMFYSVPHQVAISFIENKSQIFYHDQCTSGSSVEMYTYNYWLERRLCKRSHTISYNDLVEGKSYYADNFETKIKKGKPHINYEGVTIVILNRENQTLQIQDSIDYLIIGNYPLYKFKRSENRNFKTIILNEFGYYEHNSWCRYLNSQGIDYIDLSNGCAKLVKVRDEAFRFSGKPPCLMVDEK